MRTRAVLLITLLALLATLVFAADAEQAPSKASKTRKVDPRCPYGCLNGGECTADGCECKTGYVGIDCGNRGCDDNCNDRGYCYIGLTSVRCICHPDWMGASCDVRRPVSANALQSLAFSEAQRLAGGKNKNKPPSATSSTSSSTSTVANTKASTKAAAPKTNTLLTGFNKASDQEPPADIVCPKPCANEGVCKNKKCYCKDGYGGADCALVLCPNDCSGRGECDFNTGTCLCSPPYIGRSCETASKNAK